MARRPRIVPVRPVPLAVAGGANHNQPASRTVSRHLRYSMRRRLLVTFAVVVCTVSGCSLSPTAVVGCGPFERTAEPAAPGGVTLQLDDAGARAIMRALEQDSLSDADVDALLSITGVRATVDNVTRFIPGLGIPEFRAEIRQFARRKRDGEYPEFQLSHVWSERGRTGGLISEIQAEESALISEVLSLLEPYTPAIGPLDLRVHLVAGGVSDGFVLEDGLSFYINLTRAAGDCTEVMANVVHESYHAMQMEAQRRSGTFSAWVTDDSMAPVNRVLAGTLAEGTATLVADPSRVAAPGQGLRSARARYQRGTDPAQIAANFAVFDSVLTQLSAGRLTWAEASSRGFARSPKDEERFYFVGYQMAKTLERHCGRECVGSAFTQEPVAFFRRYIALYREHPEIRWRFSPETEAIIASLQLPR
jgi:hypothetical protein